MSGTLWSHLQSLRGTKGLNNISNVLGKGGGEWVSINSSIPKNFKGKHRTASNCIITSFLPQSTLVSVLTLMDIQTDKPHVRWCILGQMRFTGLFPRLVMQSKENWQHYGNKGFRLPVLMPPFWSARTAIMSMNLEKQDVRLTRLPVTHGCACTCTGIGSISLYVKKPSQTLKLIIIIIIIIVSAYLGVLFYF